MVDLIGPFCYYPVKARRKIRFDQIEYYCKMKVFISFINDYFILKAQRLCASEGDIVFGIKILSNRYFNQPFLRTQLDIIGAEALSPVFKDKITGPGLSSISRGTSFLTQTIPDMLARH